VQVWALRQRLSAQGLARDEQHHELGRIGVDGPVLLGRQLVDVTLHVFAELLQPGRPLLGHFGLHGVQVGREWNLRVDEDELVVAKHHLQIRPHLRVASGGLAGLLEKVAVVEHAGDLDDALELQLTPSAAHLWTTQRGGQGAGFSPQVLARGHHGIDLLAQAGAQLAALLLDLDDPLVELQQALLDRPHQLAGGSQPLLGHRVGLQALFSQRLGRQDLELLDQRGPVATQFFGALDRGVALRLGGRQLRTNRGRFGTGLLDGRACFGDRSTPLGVVSSCPGKLGPGCGSVGLGAGSIAAGVGGKATQISQFAAAGGGLGGALATHHRPHDRSTQPRADQQRHHQQQQPHRIHSSHSARGH